MKRYAAALFVLAALIPLPGAIAGSKSQSGADLAFYDPVHGRWEFQGGPSFYYGAPGDWPILCDWDGDGTATVGVYRDTRGYLLLHDGNSTGSADYEFYYGIPGDRPVCGDWDGNGTDTIAIFRPSENKFYLRNTNTQGFGQVEFGFGFENGIPFAGDWDGDGIDTVGLRDPKNGFVHIARSHSNSDPIEAYFGASGDTLIAGDWDGDGQDRVALYRPATATLEISESLVNPKPTAIYQIASTRGVPLAGEFNNAGGLAKDSNPVQEPLDELASPPSPATTMPVWDTAWYAPAWGTIEEIDEYAAHLQSVGMTGALVMLLPQETEMLSFRNRYGHAVGNGGGASPITINADYINDFRNVLDTFHARNIRVGITPAWSDTYVRNGVLTVGNAEAFGEHVANAFGDHPAIEWWLMGGDNWEGVEDKNIWANLTTGLRNGGANQLVGYHNPSMNPPFGSGEAVGRWANEWWNQLGLMQSGHCGPVNVDQLKGFTENHNGIAGQGEPPYLGLRASWCDYHEITDADVIQAMEASIAAGVDFHVYGDVRRAAWGTGRWNSSTGGFARVRESFNSPGERDVVALVKDSKPTVPVEAPPAPAEEQPEALASPPSPTTTMPMWDTAWFAPAHATVEEVDEYAAYLQSIGMTGTLFQLLPQEDDKLAYRNHYGHQVASGGGGANITLTSEFVADLRRMLDAAHSHNIKVGLVLAWANIYVNQGDLTVNNARAFGRNVAAELGDHPAIEWWIMGGDNFESVEDPEIWAELTRGLQVGGANQRVGYHNPGGGGRFQTEWWNQLGLMQSGHCGPVDTGLLRSFVSGHNGIAGQGEPPYLGINAGWCNYHEITGDDVVRATQASLDAGGDFHVYGDVRRAAWGTGRWDNDRRGFAAVRDTFGTAVEQRVMALVYD